MKARRLSREMQRAWRPQMRPMRLLELARLEGADSTGAAWTGGLAPAAQVASEARVARVALGV
jgi:hypothetical protein